MLRIHLTAVCGANAKRKNLARFVLINEKEDLLNYLTTVKIFLRLKRLVTLTSGQ